MEATLKSQKVKILNYLKRYGRITPITALNHFGSFNLKGRIFDLRQDGHMIRTDRNKGKKKYGIYVLIND